MSVDCRAHSLVDGVLTQATGLADPHRVGGGLLQKDVERSRSGSGPAAGQVELREVLELCPCKGQQKNINGKLVPLRRELSPEAADQRADDG